MIVDSSTIVALLLRQPGHEVLLDALARLRAAAASPSLMEAGIVLMARLGPSGRTLLARFVAESELAVVPFTDAHWGVAVDAFTRFGKGRHPAALNFGDCLTYATARLADEPLLSLGDDFARTDLALAPVSET